MTQNFDRIVDVVVVGSGGAALVAATLAADGGSSVIVLEKSAQIGGTTGVSGGGVWVPCNSQMAVLGEKDSREDALAYLRALTKGSEPEPAMLETFVDTAAEMIDYLERKTPLRMFSTANFPDYYAPYGVPGAKVQGRSLEPRPYPVGKELADWRHRLASRVTMSTLGGSTTLEEDLSGKPVDAAEIERRKREDIRPKGAALIGALWKGLLERGVASLLEAPAKELILAEGAAVGVVCEQAGKRIRIGARQGVVLACGGFEWNAALVKAHVGFALHPLSPPNNTGDGLNLAIQAGASLAQLSSHWGSGVMYDPTVVENGKVVAQFDTARGMPGTLIVNQSGRRFVNEAVPYNDFTKPFAVFDPVTVDFANKSAWQIFDHALKEQMPILSMEPGKPAPSWVPQAATIRELATRIGIDPDALDATVRRFNEHAARGEDPEFQRGKIGFQRLAKPRPLDQAPYYAIAIYPGTLGTNGGPRIDVDARVVRAAGGVVPGLYAAGNTAASSLGWLYPGGGATLANGMTFGYRAGRHVAKEPRRNL